MHRFRKRSDAKRAPLPDPLRAPQLEPLPSLPPPEDFRTSLILPDLTRRFSVLRSSSGTPIALDDLKLKFAEQRARGSENQVSEEEEDMILEALGRLHAQNARPRANSRASDEQSALGPGLSPSTPQFSIHSSESSATATLHSSPSMTSLSSAKGSHRRMSNNLFGSGKLRDQTYMRAAQSPRRPARSTRTLSATPSESNMSVSSGMTGGRPAQNVSVYAAPDGSAAGGRPAQNASIYSDKQSLRPVTPDGSASNPSSSAPSSPNNDRHLDAAPQLEYVPDTPLLGARLSRALSPDGLHRASMALDEVIRELEEEGDDEIVMERLPVLHTPVATSVVPLAFNAEPSGECEAGTAVSSDAPMVSGDAQRASPYPRSRTVSPTPRLPGYIPGMPRPMTPRETSFDADDLTPSSTPRATSPRLPGTAMPVSAATLRQFASGLHRSSSDASTRQASRPVSPPVQSTSPLFFNRSTNGRYTPESRPRAGSVGQASDTAESPTSRRLPASPLSAPAFQPRTLPPSRPTTPSNITWNTSASSVAKHGRNSSSVSGHSRSGSSVSLTDAHGDALERSTPRSPALPDSPKELLDRARSPAIDRPPSAMSGQETSSMLNRPLRSPTPTYGLSRSPTTPAFTDSHINGSDFSPSRRSSKQSAPAHMSFNTTHASGLLLSPIANSSRSSLESAGSSYHSWDEDHKNRLLGLLSSLDSEQTEWHDVSKSSSSTPGTSPYEGVDYEDAVRRQSGLTKSDFVAIQDKLVSAALAKAATPEGRARASSIRRRRPSTSQSNYSVNGTVEQRVKFLNGCMSSVDSVHFPQVVSPTPQPQPVASSSRIPNSDHIAKANALLDSVVDSINSPRAQAAQLPPPAAVPAASASTPQSPTTSELSSPGRRHRALADVLFGEDGGFSNEMPQLVLGHQETETPRAQELSLSVTEAEPVPEPERPAAPWTPAAQDVSLPRGPGLTASTPTSPWRDHSSLALDVQRRAEAATAALRKSPSIPKLADANGTTPRRKISPHQISSPKLVSASTSVDTIPLRPTTPAGSTHEMPSGRIGSRFKKLRGTLKTRPPVSSSEEVTPFPFDMRTPPSVQQANYSTANLSLRGEPAASSATDPGRFKAPVPPLPSPPASAAPGLKGFMARFRKQKPAEMSYQRPVPGSASWATSVSSSSHFPTSASSSSPSSLPSVSHRDHGSEQSHSAPPTRIDFMSSNMDPRAMLPPISPGLSEGGSTPMQAQNDEVALKQLFDAASNLGLDQAALNDLLARSPSTSSRSTAWTKMTRMTSMSDKRKSAFRNTQDSSILSRSHSPHPSEGRPSVDNYSPRPSTEAPPQPTFAPLRPRPARGDGAAGNNIVRRTIIVPSDTRTSTFDLAALMRKQSTSRKRQSAGATSTHSKGSVQERVPTPPPQRTSTSRRFSADGSPPVPRLPPSIAARVEHLAVPAQMENSSSTYDSLYDMYSGEGKAAGASSLEAQSVPYGANGLDEAHDGSGPAIEVVELANGETIWSIVNGLRDTDGTESFYGDRASFISEYSLKDNNEGLKVFFKGHERKSSRGSTSSFLSRKKHPAKAASRPETKVFFSSSAQIGRLIENLSSGVDAGSFNITPELPQTRAQHQLHHSASSSVGSSAQMSWTVEERLEHMLGTIGSDS
ncbi:hypothetical protein OBBRIDRAFT_607128 [Obba rivulosa]|uniref:Uncharacterized protein n=1 Tax=Obba rivulosa TaxID=1052685 RepID=A0A8E2AW57_9APHY|nr:hypothetical protein OBBRIDRAFT_607128 [Obba rivulosa]